MALREGRFSRSAHDTLAESTIRNTISFVGTTFRQNGHPNPTLDEDRQLSMLLQRQFRAFRNKDPPPKQQAALPLAVLVERSKLQATETQKAIVQLSIVAFFFACRSCEYLKVPQADKRRTDILRLRCIRFFKDGVQLRHDSPRLEFADCVSVTFEKQKKDERNDTTTQIATDDSLLCPVKQWAAIVKRIWTYPGTTYDTKVSTVLREGVISHITSKMMIDALRDAAESYGLKKLNINKEDIGTHSIRSGAAMAMYLDEVSIFSIMMIGRWQSDAFLKYIRKQVEQFSHNVSQRMIRNQYFRHIPDQERNTHHDPRNLY